MSLSRKDERAERDEGIKNARIYREIIGRISSQREEEEEEEEEREKRRKSAVGKNGSSPDLAMFVLAKAGAFSLAGECCAAPIALCKLNALAWRVFAICPTKTNDDNEVEEKRLKCEAGEHENL